MHATTPWVLRIAFLVGLGLVIASSVASGATTSVPSGELLRIRAVVAPYAFVPGTATGGAMFIRWSDTALNPASCGRLLSIEFAASSARQIDWTASRACASNGRAGCSSKGYRGYGYGLEVGRQATINSRPAYYSAGAQGSNAWTCFPIKTSHGRDYVEVGLWESNFMSPAAAMRLVATAKPVS